MEKIKKLVNKINIYNLIIFNLTIFSIIGVYVFGFKATFVQLLIAIIASSLLDSLFNYYIYKKLMHQNTENLPLKNTLKPSPEALQECRVLFLFQPDAS